MKGRALSLDSDIRGRPVLCSQTLADVGFVDDVIIDPTSRILAVVAHKAGSGTWAFPYSDVQVLSDVIIVVLRGKASPRRFLRGGRSYQDLLGGEVVRTDGSVIGRIRDVHLVDSCAGGIAYRVSTRGIRSLWTTDVVIHAPAAVIRSNAKGIVIKDDGGFYDCKDDEDVGNDRSDEEMRYRCRGPVEQHS